MGLGEIEDEQVHGCEAGGATGRMVINTQAGIVWSDLVNELPGRMELTWREGVIGIRGGWFGPKRLVGGGRGGGGRGVLDIREGCFGHRDWCEGVLDIREGCFAHRGYCEGVLDIRGE